METIFVDVSLDKIEYVDNLFDILIHVTDAINHEYTIYCKHVNILKMQNTYNFSDDEKFPIFVTEINHEKLSIGKEEIKFKSLGYEFTEGFPYNQSNKMVIPQNDSYSYLCIEGSIKIEVICFEIMVTLNREQ